MSETIKIKTEKIPRVKSSWYIDPIVIEAMNVVKDVEGIAISRQIETGAKLFLERHDELLKSRGIDVWRRKSKG